MGLVLAPPQQQPVLAGVDGAGRPAASDLADFEDLLAGSTAEAPSQQSWPAGWVVEAFGCVSILLITSTPLGSFSTHQIAGLASRAHLFASRERIP